MLNSIPIKTYGSGQYVLMYDGPNSRADCDHAPVGQLRKIFLRATDASPGQSLRCPEMNTVLRYRTASLQPTFTMPS